MKINRFVNAMAGDEASKNELKLAYRKALRVAIFSGLIALAIVFPIACLYIPNDLGIGDKIFSVIITSFLSFAVVSAFIGSQSLNFFTKHLKITLPETIAPKIEIIKK